MRANNCAAMKIHLINRTKMSHFKIAKISICQKLCAKTLKLVPAINCNLKVRARGYIYTTEHDQSFSPIVIIIILLLCMHNNYALSKYVRQYAICRHQNLFFDQYCTLLGQVHNFNLDINNR